MNQESTSATVLSKNDEAGGRQKKEGGVSTVLIPT